MPPPGTGATVAAGVVAVAWGTLNVPGAPHRCQTWTAIGPEAGRSVFTAGVRSGRAGLGAGVDGGSIVFVPIVAVVVLAVLVLTRGPRAEPDAFPFEGMFGYEADLGWPRGVQESDGERAWTPRAIPPVPGQPAAEDSASSPVETTSTIAEIEDGVPVGPVPVSHVRIEPRGRRAVH